MRSNPIPTVREEIKIIHSSKKEEIQSRLDEFKSLWKNGTEEDIFAELVFCLLTPQSKARSCWAAVEDMVDNNLLFNGSESHIAKSLRSCVRFHNNKARYIRDARRMFTIEDELHIKNIIIQPPTPYKAREWLVENVKGMGYKEASHFLRNIGIGEQLAILDRHILKNLVMLEVIMELPSSLSSKRYLSIERSMAQLSKEIGIPMAHLDLLLWYKEAGEIFK